MNIEHIGVKNRGAFGIKRDHKRVAEMTYARDGDEVIVIDHTEVAEDLRGQKIGDPLLAEAVKYARENGLKVRATCPFALRKLQASQEYSDVFAG